MVPENDDLYFIYDPIRIAVKIGRSVNPARRLRQLQTGHASELQLILVLKGDGPRELEFHERFASARLAGEWFRYRDVKRALRGLPMRTPAPPKPVPPTSFDFDRLWRVAESKVIAGGNRFPFERFRKEMLEDGLSEQAVSTFLNTVAAGISGERVPGPGLLRSVMTQAQHQAEAVI